MARRKLPGLRVLCAARALYHPVAGRTSMPKHTLLVATLLVNAAFAQDAKPQDTKPQDTKPNPDDPAALISPARPLIMQKKKDEAVVLVWRAVDLRAAAAGCGA